MQITDISITLLDPSPINPRRHYDQPGIEELAASIEEKGIIQPLSVRPKAKGKFEIIVGHRRYHASMFNYKKKPGSNGLDYSLPCIIREMSDDEALEIMIVENLQRKDVHPMDEAAGFLQLTKIKHMDVREIAMRIGKPVSYVAQRMKLNDLIEPIQKCLFENRLSIKDAITISSLTPEDQKALHRDQRMDSDPHFKLNEYSMRKYSHKLNQAPFDITDASLKPGVTACTTCPFNSAVNLLFPELADNPVCNNPKCYRSKCDLSFKRELAAAQEDPTVAIVPSTRSYLWGSDHKKVEALSKAIKKTLPLRSYETIAAPEYPDPEDFMDYDESSKAGNEKAFKQAVKEYESELEVYNKKVASGKYQRAFVLGGDEKGKYILINVIKQKAVAKPADNGSTVSEEEVQLKSQISTLREREKQATANDAADLMDKITDLCNPNEVIKLSSGKLTQWEIDALVYLISRDISYHNQGKFMKALNLRSDAMANIEMETLHVVLRYWMADKVMDTGRYADKNESAKAKEVVSMYYPEKVAYLEAAAAEASKKRSAAVADKIAKLQAKMKALKKPMSPTDGTTTVKTPAGRRKAVSKAKKKAASGIKKLVNA